MFFRNVFTIIALLLSIINTSNQFKSISKNGHPDIFNHSKNKFKYELNARPIKYFHNRFPLTEDGHCDDEARLWSRIQIGEILSGNLHKNKYGNFFVRANLPGEFKDKSITVSLSRRDNLLYETLLNKQVNLRTDDDVDKENKEIMIDDTLETCKNLVLLKGRNKMDALKIDWGLTPTFNVLRTIDSNKLANIEHEVLITKVNPQKRIVMGELFTHERVEQKRIGYLTFYNNFYKSMQANQRYHVKCLVESVYDNYVVLDVLDGLKGYALREGAIKRVRAGDILDLIGVGSDPMLHRIYLAPDDGELTDNYSALVRRIEKYVLSDWINRDEWFKVELMKYTSHAVVVRMCGIEHPILATIPMHFLPYAGRSGVIDSMYIYNFYIDKKYGQRYTASKLGKLCYISHYDDTLYVRLQSILCNHESASKSLLDIIDSENIYPVLTTRPVVKWSEEMLKVSKKMESQTLAQLQSLSKQHFYPTKILFQANGYVYVSVNFEMKPNFDFENEGVIGVVPIDEFFGYAKPGALIHTRINKIETFKREGSIIRCFNEEKKDAIIRNSTILGPANESRYSHVLYMSSQTPNFDREEVKSDPSYSYFELIKDSFPDSLENYSKLAEFGYFSIICPWFDIKYFDDTRYDAIRCSFTKKWYDMYMNELNVADMDVVSKLYDTLSYQSVHLFDFISSFTDFHKFKTLSMYELIAQFKNLVKLTQEIKFLPLERIHEQAVEETMFYKIMSATILPRTGTGLDFITRAEVNSILDKFVPDDIELRNKIIKESLDRSMKLVLPNILIDYTRLSSYASRKDLAIAILATLANQKYGLMALARMRHRTMPIPVFASSRQMIHRSSMIRFNHPHKYVTHFVQTRGVNIFTGIRSMPPWPYLIKSSHNLFSHLADMGMFELACIFNRLVQMTRSEESNKNIPIDLPEDYITAMDVINNDYEVNIDKDASDETYFTRSELLEAQRRSKNKKEPKPLSSDFTKEHSKEDLEKFFKQLEEMNLEYGIRVPLF